MEITHLNPDSLHKNPAFSQGVHSAREHALAERGVRVQRVGIQVSDLHVVRSTATRRHPQYPY